MVSLMQARPAEPVVVDSSQGFQLCLHVILLLEVDGGKVVGLKIFV